MCFPIQGLDIDGVDHLDLGPVSLMFWNSAIEETGEL